MVPDADAGFPTPSNGVSPIPKIPKEVTRTKLPGQDITEKFDRGGFGEIKVGASPIPLNLYKKIHKIIAEEIKVGKDGRNDFHKYDYTTEASVVEAMRDVFSKHNLAYDFDVLDVYQVLIDGKEITRTKARITLIDLDTGEFKINHIFGDGQDKGDKGVYKSYTGLQKYYFMKSFLLSTGDDPELETGGNKTPSAPRAATPTQNATPSAPAKPRAVSLPVRRGSGNDDPQPSSGGNTQSQAQAAAPTPATSANTSAETAPQAAQPTETKQETAPATSAEAPKKVRAKFNPPKRVVKAPETRDE